MPLWSVKFVLSKHFLIDSIEPETSVGALIETEPTTFLLYGIMLQPSDQGKTGQSLNKN